MTGVLARRETDTRDAGTEGRSREDTVRRSPSARREASGEAKPNFQILDF